MDNKNLNDRLTEINADIDMLWKHWTDERDPLKRQAIMQKIMSKTAVRYSLMTEWRNTGEIPNPK